MIPVVGLTSIAYNTSAFWSQSTVVVPPGVLCCEHEQVGRQVKDKLKIGDGTKTFSELPYLTEELFKYKYFLPFALQDNPGGLIQLDGQGTIPETFFMDVLVNKPKVVPDITARDALPLGDRYCIVIVANTTLDESTNGGGASYVWHFEEGIEPGHWIKITEYGSFDIDFSDFVKKDDAIDRLSDTENFVKTTVEERESLENMLLEDRNYHFTPNTNNTLFTPGNEYLGGGAADTRRHVLTDNAFVEPALILIDTALPN